MNRSMRRGRSARSPLRRISVASPIVNLARARFRQVRSRLACHLERLASAITWSSYAYALVATQQEPYHRARRAEPVPSKASEFGTEMDFGAGKSAREQRSVLNQIVASWNTRRMAN